MYRSSTSTDDGYVSIYSGSTGPLHLLTSDIVSQNTGASNNTKGRQWSTSGNVSNNYLSGTFSTGNIPVGDQKLYAVYFNYLSNIATKEAVSDPIAIVPGTVGPPPPSPTPPSSTVLLSDLIPCGSVVAICDDQCISKGSIPAPIKGRVLADRGYRDSEYDYNGIYEPAYTNWSNYLKLTNNTGTARFAEGYEIEMAQWQYRTNYSDWVDINGANNASYSPGVINETTYFRRVSTHLRYRFPTNYREEWYKSNIVTIRIPASAPVAFQNPYIACGTSSIDVAVRQASDATSYAWFCADPNVKINGQSTSYYNQYNSTSIVVKVTLPSGTAQGASYPIYVSAIGPCGARSSISTVNVTVNCTVSAPPSVSFISSVSGTTCQPRYDVRVGRSLGATSYAATLHGTSLYEGYSKTVTADPNAYYVDLVRFPGLSASSE